MMLLAALAAIVLILMILRDAFDAVVMPRRVARRLPLSGLLTRVVWKLWSRAGRRIDRTSRRENWLSYSGPLTMVLLLAVWAVGLIFGFGLLYFGLESPVRDPENSPGFPTYLYLSGTTFFTLGLGDVTPLSWTGRALTVLEAGLGFAFLALVIGYLPVLYQAFSRREVRISMLDQWAGSPPTAGEFFRRIGKSDGARAIEPFFQEWEYWSAEVLESHLSYPILAYFRSQHGNQSWVAGLTMVMDACALVLAHMDGIVRRQAWLTFAMARHAVVDLCLVFNTPPRAPETERLSQADHERLQAVLAGSGLPLREGTDAGTRLTELRRSYEPYVAALATHLLMPLPPFIPAGAVKDNWQKTAWE